MTKEDDERKAREIREGAERTRAALAKVAKEEQARLDKEAIKRANEESAKRNAAGNKDWRGKGK